MQSVSGVLSRRTLCWAFLAAFGLTWTAVLFLTGQQLLMQDASGGNRPSYEAASLQSKVTALESELAVVREDLTQKDRLVVILQEQLATARSNSGDSAESAKSATGLGRLLENRADEVVRSGWPQQSGSSLRGSLAGQRAEQPRYPPEHKCDFQMHVDYRMPAGSGLEEIAQSGVSRDICCALCADRNEQRPGSCLVAVLSSQDDTPALSCWIKGGRSGEMLSLNLLRPVSKHGVSACFPPGHDSLPTAPPPPPDPNHVVADHERGLAKLNEFTGVGPLSASMQQQRANAVREAVRHAWTSYKNHAWGMDELNPVAGRGRNRNFNHAVTLVDSLDTLWLVGLKDEFHEAKTWAVEHLGTRFQTLAGSVSIFETTIRSLGGLLAAYDLSREKVLLDLAVQLGRRILSSVNAQGVTPYTFAGGRGGMGCNSLAESGTIQLEMRYLSHVTGDKSFETKVMRFYDIVRNLKSFDGLWPNCYGSQRGKITMGADGDSFYEYLIKVFIQGGRKDSESFLWSMYDKAVNGMEKHMVRKGSDGLTYLGTLSWDGNENGNYVAEMEHLTCFVPGWLALGAHSPEGAESRSHRMELADAIATTCWKMYETQPTGLGPERVKGQKMDLSSTNTREYILRPEAVEGWWYMSEFTQDPKYREWGWKTFLNFEKWLWVPNGYASYQDVTNVNKKYIDRMESFFIAETLKYLYLLQDASHTMKLDRYVFNTEAHPLSILEYAPKPL